MSFILILALIVGVFITGAIGSGTNELAQLCAHLFPLLVLALYFSPSAVAALRKSPHGPQIAILNFFLGWTLIGWVAALVWAYAPRRAGGAT